MFVFLFFMLCTYFFQNKSINICAYVYIFCLGDICVNMCIYFVCVHICEGEHESQNLKNSGFKFKRQVHCTQLCDLSQGNYLL